MVNPLAGEVSVAIDGRSYACKLTLGALAELETSLAEPSLVDLVKRFESGSYADRDVLAVIVAGLRGGGWQGTSEDLLSAEIENGPIGAAKVAATLLARAFTPPK